MRVTLAVKENYVIVWQHGTIGARTGRGWHLADHGFHPLRVARVVQETTDASSFVLEVPDDLASAFAYEAGQFCTFRVELDGHPHVRCYSMSSSPAVDSELQVTVKRVPGGGVSNWLIDHLAAGDTVEVSLPTGSSNSPPATATSSPSVPAVASPRCSRCSSRPWPPPPAGPAALRQPGRGA